MKHEQGRKLINPKTIHGGDPGLTAIGINLNEWITWGEEVNLLEMFNEKEKPLETSLYGVILHTVIDLIEIYC